MRLVILSTISLALASFNGSLKSGRSNDLCH